MFYCDNCAKKHGWMITEYKSFGLCECCEEYRGLCNEKDCKDLAPIREYNNLKWEKSMNNFIFRVKPHHEITVELNSKFLFIQNWHDDMTTEENVLAAVRAAERLRDEMSEQGKRAAEAGRQLKEKLLC